MKKAMLITFGVMTLALLSLAFYLFSLVPRADIEKLHNGYVAYSIENNSEAKVSYKVVTKKPKTWKSLNQISTHLVNAVLLSEDWSFYEHDGVDYKQVAEALDDGLNGKKLRGASTISQQVVKNVFLSSERSYWRKLKEMGITFWLEYKLSKDKILEVYLNIAHWGEGVYGAEGAARYYFSKSAGALNPLEAAYLATLLPSPVRYGESFRKKELTDFARNNINSILDKMVVAKKLSSEEAYRYKRTPLFRVDTIIKKQKRKFSKKKLFHDGNELEGYYAHDPDSLVKENIKYDDDALDEKFEIKDQEFSLE